ncbi:MAG TPA: FAD:protein FMN transferase [Xanthobacteraceae bacterium]|nr:FAD:protein FMN transferase [Xanthobacteraceae bacterium]
MEATRVSIRRARPLLGTFVEIAASGQSLDAAEAAVEAAFSAVATVHSLMSFHEPGSDVSRLNRGAGSGAIRVHHWTCQVLEVACDLNSRSGGIFDISVAPALQKLGLLPKVPEVSAPSNGGVIAREGACKQTEGLIPRSARLRARLEGRRLAGPCPGPSFETAARRNRLLPISTLQACRSRASPTSAGGLLGIRAELFHPLESSAGAIQLLPENRVRFADPSVKIDLGGIAKGFAVDRAVEALRRHGIAEGLVNAGGDLRGFGSPSHAVDIRDPREPSHPLCRVALRNAALASSAGLFDPVRSHRASASAVIDPATATPARSIIGATVCAGSCVIADALTKVVMNAGEAAAPLLEHYGADALFVSASGVVHMTANWKNEVRLAA